MNQSPPLKQEALTEMDKLKNEVFQYLSKIESKLDKRLSQIEEKQSQSLLDFHSQIEDTALKTASLNDIVMQQKVKFDKVEELEAFRRKSEDQLISHEIRLNNLRKEFDRAVTRYDRIYLDNLIVPGYIGDCAQFKNMREYIDHNIGQVSNLITSKEKMNIDLREIKSRLEGTVRMFSSQVETYNKTHNDHINRKHMETQEYIAEQMKVINDEFIELRMSNCKYAIDLKNKASELNVEWERMLAMKDEIHKEFNDKVEEFKQTENKTNLNVFNMSNDFKKIKASFNELAQFIKDVRFRKNFEKFEKVTKKETQHLAKKIEFSLKKAKSIDIGSLSNAKEEDISIGYASDNNNAESNNGVDATIAKTNASPQEIQLQAPLEQIEQKPENHTRHKSLIEEEIIIEKSPEEEETKKRFMPQTGDCLNDEGVTVKERPETAFFKKHPNLIKGFNKPKNFKIVFTEFKEGTEKSILNDNSTDIKRTTTDKSLQSPNPLSKRSHKLLTALKPEALKIVELSFDQNSIHPSNILDFNRDYQYQLKQIEMHKRTSKKFKTVKESPQRIKACFGTLAPSLIRKTKTNGKDTIDCSIKLPNLVLRNYSREAQSP